MRSAEPSTSTVKIGFDGALFAACLAVLMVGSALALQAAWRWPLVGDSALIRYVVFLLHNGKAPYSQVVDINLPGSYLLEALAMKCFGWGAIGLRCYDGFLCLAFCILAWLLIPQPTSQTSQLDKTTQRLEVAAVPSAQALSAKGKRERLACFAGGLLFLLIHLQDGLTEAGQRDLALAVLMLAGVVVLLRGRGRPLPALFCFELIVGFGLTIKPTIWPMLLLPLLLWNAHSTLPARSWRKMLGAAAAGALLSPALAAGWLLWTGSLHAFLNMATSIGALHGQLGRHGPGFLAAHCTAPVTVLFVLWLVVLATRTLPFDAARRLLLAATACGLLSYLEQGKGLSYQRYPFLGMALVLIGLDLARASQAARDMSAAAGLPMLVGRVREADSLGNDGKQGKSPIRRLLDRSGAQREDASISRLRHGRLRRVAYAASLAAVASVTLWFAPRFTLAVRGFDTTQPFEDHLARSLRALPGPVQCLDTFGGCIDTLYQMRSVQATGYLYDCYLFTPPGAVRDAYRQQFLSSFNAARPPAVVLTNQPCFDPAKNYDRLESWPAFARQIQREYRLQEEWHTEKTYRWWSRWERPIAYRIYVLR